MVPKVDPRPLATEFTDIIKPLNSESCSKVKLFPAKKEEEANRKRIIDAAAEIQNTLRLKTLTVSNPRRSEAGICQ